MTNCEDIANSDYHDKPGDDKGPDRSEAISSLECQVAYLFEDDASHRDSNHSSFSELQAESEQVSLI